MRFQRCFGSGGEYIESISLCYFRLLFILLRSRDITRRAGHPTDWFSPNSSADSTAAASNQVDSYLAILLAADRDFHIDFSASSFLQICLWIVAGSQKQEDLHEICSWGRQQNRLWGQQLALMNQNSCYWKKLWQQDDRDEEPTANNNSLWRHARQGAL